MSDGRTPTLSSAKLALAIRRLRTERPDAELLNSDPLPSSAWAAAFPETYDLPQDYWRLLRDGVDAISKAPADRWDEILLRSRPVSLRAR